MYSTHSTHKSQPRLLGHFLLNLGRYINVSTAAQNAENATHKSTRNPAVQTQKLADVADSASDILFAADTVFPFTLFPDTVKVDRRKIIVIHREFFSVANTHNIQLHDIQSIEADTGPFFGTLQITTEQFENTVLKIHFLTRSDTLKAQRLLQGVVIANQQKIDYADIPIHELVPLLEKLGCSNTG